MKQCLTLVANRSLEQAQWQKAIHSMLTIEQIHQREAHVWDVITDDHTTLSSSLRDVLYQLNIDFALQPKERLPKRLFLSDMDATMVVGETIDEMAETLGLYDAVSQITAAAMRGEKSYREALAERLQLMRGIHKSEVAEIAKNVQLAKGARQLLSVIKQQHIESFLISGGFTVFTHTVAQMLGFGGHLANRLSYDKSGKLDGNWIGDLVSAEVKESTLKTLAKQLDIELSETIAIGDGANDKRMVRLAGLGVAFYGKPTLREAANAEIHSGTIDNLRWFL